MMESSMNATSSFSASSLVMDGEQALMKGIAIVISVIIVTNVLTPVLMIFHCFFSAQRCALCPACFLRGIARPTITTPVLVRGSGRGNETAQVLQALHVITVASVHPAAMSERGGKDLTGKRVEGAGRMAADACYIVCGHVAPVFHVSLAQVTHYTRIPIPHAERANGRASC